MAAGCLRCLFDIKLHGSDTEAHSNAHIEMDEEAANLVFTLVESELLDTLRSRKGSGLRGDLKAIVDKTSSVLGDFDITKCPRISMNMDAIDDYLDGPSMPLFAQVNKALCTDDWIIVPTSCLPTKRLVFNDLKATSAHLNMPFVRAVTQHDLLLSRMRSGLTRAVEEYDNIIEDYKLNVAINPTSSEAWYYLAQAHSDLADELLLGTASEIISSRYDIAVLQRSAVSCAVQAKQLLPPLHAGSTPSSGDDSNSSDEDLFEQTQKLHIRLYSFVGCLLYRIASKPLSLLAFQILPSNVLVPDDDVDEERQEWDTGVWKPFKQTAHTMSAAEGGSVASIARTLTRRFVKAPPRLQVYSLACKLLAVASRLDAENWKWIAHLETSSNVKHASSVIGSLPSIAHTLSSTSGTSAQAVPVNQQIPVSSVPESAMSAIYKLLSMLAKLLHQRSIDVDMAMRFLNNLPFSAASNLDSRALSESSKSVSMEDGRMAAFEAIYSLASQPDFEAPGKHYHYLEKYLGLYIDILVATSDIEGVRVLLRKLKRCSDLFFDSNSMLQRVKAAEFATIDRMVHDLNCPRFVVDDLGKEHIVLQDALSGARFAKEYSVTRHCRLNRTQFNFARDFARDNISFYISLKEHINNIVAAREKENAGQRDSVVETDSTLEPADNAKTSLDVIKRAQQEIEQYVDSATKALAMFDILLEKKKKHFDDADILFRLNENMADLYILVLSIYGQERLYSLSQPHQCDDIDELANLCTKAISLINSHQDPKGTSNSFWQRVLFDEANNESSQQYKLLDPLLEFNVNKLLDAVRDARALQPNPFVRSKQRMDTAQVLVQAAPKSTLATSSNGGLQQANQPSTS
ncbi:Histone transcription regulator 3 [Coemansia sp. RSA 1939]|nr:Histone transcription regulator 3 [Coemansia sp. RSA 1939]